MASRSRFRIAFVVLALGASGVYALACADSGGPSSGGASSGDGGTAALPDAAVAPNDAEAPATTMRLAHVAQDLGPVDFCYRTTSSTSFLGPVLGGGLGGIKKDAGAADADAGEGGAPGLDAGDDNDDDDTGDGGDAGEDAGAVSVGYRSVSRYLTLAASGPLTLALVAPGATSCATPLFVADVTLDPGKLSTVAVVGRTSADAGDEQLALVAFIDDRITVPDQARVRMVHAAFGTAGGRAAAAALSARASGSTTLRLADVIAPKKAGAPSATVPVDSLGYATIAPLPSPAQLAVGAAAVGSPPANDASADSWVSQAAELDLRGGSLHTGFILSSDEQPYEVLWCTDTALAGDRALCAIVR